MAFELYRRCAGGREKRGLLHRAVQRARLPHWRLAGAHEGSFKRDLSTALYRRRESGNKR